MTEAGSSVPRCALAVVRLWKNRGLSSVGGVAKDSKRGLGFFALQRSAVSRDEESTAMSGWLDRLRNIATESRSASRPEAAPRDMAAEVGGRIDSVLETARKTARAVAKLEASFESLEAQVSELATQARRREDEFLAPLMDALDLLDAARSAIASGHADGTEAGLSGIQQRLESLLDRAGYARHSSVGVPVDGRLQRVVGTQPSASGPNHSVARVVRAAVTRGDVIVRGGEVIAIQNAEGSSG